MLSVRRIAALVLKESLQIARDPSSIFIAFVLPLALLLLFGYGVTLDLRGTGLGVALEDGGAEARSLSSMFEGSASFSVNLAADRRELMRDLSLGKLKGVLVIPNGFSAAVREQSPSRPPTVQIVTDGTFPNTAELVRGYAVAIASSWFAHAARTAPPIAVTTRVWYNEGVDSRFFIIPALIVVIMTLTGTMLTALVVAREWERGTMEAMLASPVTRLELLLGKLIPYYLLAILSTFFCVFFSTNAFGIPYRGSLFMLWCVGSAFMLCALAIGLIISNVTRNQYAASIGALMISFLPSVLLSGGVFELSSMPVFQQIIAAFMPAKYLTTCLLTLFLVGDVMELILPSLSVLCVLGAVGMAVTYALTATRIR